MLNCNNGGKYNSSQTIMVYHLRSPCLTIVVQVERGPSSKQTVMIFCIQSMNSVRDKRQYQEDLLYYVKDET